jgi:hypothetical protein
MIICGCCTQRPRISIPYRGLIFFPEYGGSMFLRNVCNDLPDYMAEGTKSTNWPTQCISFYRHILFPLPPTNLYPCELLRCEWNGCEYHLQRCMKKMILASSDYLKSRSECYVRALSEIYVVYCCLSATDANAHASLICMRGMWLSGLKWVRHETPLNFPVCSDSLKITIFPLVRYMLDCQSKCPYFRPGGRKCLGLEATSIHLSIFPCYYCHLYAFKLCNQSQYT